MTKRQIDSLIFLVAGAAIAGVVVMMAAPLFADDLVGSYDLVGATITYPNQPGIERRFEVPQHARGHMDILADGTLVQTTAIHLSPTEPQPEPAHVSATWEQLPDGRLRLTNGFGVVSILDVLETRPDLVLRADAGSYVEVDRWRKR